MKSQIALAVVAGALVAAAAFAADAPPQMSPAQQAMMEKMVKAATPGAPHALLAKMAGEWTGTVKLQMNPSQPAQEFQNMATITVLMDGRYIQETVSGQWGGMPYSGMSLYGFDNVSGKYAATMIDNMGTGFMTCVGTPDESGKVIRWVGTMNDPATGKPTTEHMVTTVTDDDHHTVEMFGTPPGARKEMKIMTIDYVRKP